MIPTSAQKQILSIQYLRAIAALLVVFQHTREQIPAFAQFLTFTGGPGGVDLFFVISGFIMTVTVNGVTAREFMAKRVIRIVPLYWFFTLLVSSIAFIAPDVLRSTVVSGETLLKSLLFIPHMSLGHPGQVWPILVPGWTLTYEMFFYCVLAALLWLPLANRIVIISLLFFLLAVVGKNVFALDTITVLRPLTSLILFEFVAGMIAGYLFLYREPLPASAAFVLLAVGSALLILQAIPGDRLFTRGIPALMIVIAATSLERANRVPDSKIGKILGDASYSIYLSHLFSLFALRFAWKKAGLVNDAAASAFGFAAVAMIAVALSGVVIYLIIERRLTSIAQWGYRGISSWIDLTRSRTAPQASIRRKS